MTDRLRDLIERARHWPNAAQEEAITSLEAIEEDFVVDANFAADLKQAHEEAHRGQGIPQEDLFEQFGL
jgi:hypothetical protein